MDNRRSLYKRVLFVLLPMVILAGIIIGSCQIKRTHIKANNNVVYVKAKVTQIIEDNSGGQPFGGAQKVSAKITGGQYKGQNCELDNSNSFQRGAFCTTGTKVIAVVKDIDGVITGSVYNYDRTMMVYVLLGLFSLCLVLVGGKKGAAALYALIFTYMYVCSASLYRSERNICGTSHIGCDSCSVDIYIKRNFFKDGLCNNRNNSRHNFVGRSCNDCRQPLKSQRI